jgi:protein TonB
MMTSTRKKSIWGPIGIVAGLVAVCGFATVISQLSHSGGSALPPPPRDIVSVRLPPPPVTPPPVLPPTPPPQTEVKQQMLDQTPVSEPVAKPLDTPQPASSSLGTNITGPGSADGFGLGRSGNGFVGGGGGGGSSGDRYAWYAQMVSKSVMDALARNDVTRFASFGPTRLRIWLDAAGNLVRVRLLGTTGDSRVDDAIRGEALAHLKAPEAPPDGKAVQWTMNISARRPD